MKEDSGYVVCDKCGITRNLSEASDCPICRVPKEINLDDFKDDATTASLKKRVETAAARQRTQRGIDINDEIAQMRELRDALSDNVGSLWRKIALLEAHIELLKRCRSLLTKEIRKGLTDLNE